MNAIETELIECDVCRQELETGRGYYQLTLGMDDTPSYVGVRVGASCTVESTSELIVCEGCQPQVCAEFERLLEALWRLRAPDAPEAPPGTTGDELPPTERAP